MPLGSQPILDFTVSGTHCYESGGVVHHNCGKTETGAYETAVHLTGRYPEWWEGRRFDRPVKAWAAGDTSKTVREIVQAKLLGAAGERGTGMIPGETLVKVTTKSGVADAADTVYVRHATGGISTLVLKSYDQRRESFQGTEQDLIWMDEEPPENIFTECVLRTMTTNGLVLLTFTPLNGWTEVVEKFLNETERASAKRFCVQAGWEDAPHLSEAVRAELLASIPPHQRDARAKGVPALGAGAIYPVPESEITVPDFPIPEHWPRCYALDVGWNRTAALWGALDRETGVLYLYSEHYRGDGEPVVHAEAIKARGAWIPGVIDPASRGRSQVDGRQLLQMYRDMGLDIETADNAVEAGIYTVWQRLSSGRLKAFASLQNFFAEFRRYRRDEKGFVVKQNDHLCDCLRYLAMSALDRAKTKPVKKEPKPDLSYGGFPSQSWMA